MRCSANFDLIVSKLWKCVGGLCSINPVSYTHLTVFWFNAHCYISLKTERFAHTTLTWLRHQGYLMIIRAKCLVLREIKRCVLNLKNMLLLTKTTKVYTWDFSFFLNFTINFTISDFSLTKYWNWSPITTQFTVHFTFQKVIKY